MTFIIHQSQYNNLIIMKKVTKCFFIAKPTVNILDILFYLENEG